MTRRRALLLAPFAAYSAPNPLIVHKGFPKPFLYPILAPDGTQIMHSKHSLSSTRTRRSACADGNRYFYKRFELR